jgi:DNA-binding NarL/FixJ family response regulator
MKTPTAAILTNDKFFLDSVSYFLVLRGYAVQHLAANSPAPAADLYVVHSGPTDAEAVLQYHCPTGTAGGRLVVYDTGCAPGRYQRVAQLGAHGCLTAADGLAELLTCLDCQARGEQYVSAHAQQLLQAPVASADNSPWHKLSTQERKVLALIGQGLGSKQIADALFVSAHTIKNHKSNITRKLSISSGRDLLSVALLAAGESSRLVQYSY